MEPEGGGKDAREVDERGNPCGGSQKRAIRWERCGSLLGPASMSWLLVDWGRGNFGLLSTLDAGIRYRANGTVQGFPPGPILEIWWWVVQVQVPGEQGPPSLADTQSLPGQRYDATWARN